MNIAQLVASVEAELGADASVDLVEEIVEEVVRAVVSNRTPAGRQSSARLPEHSTVDRPASPIPVQMPIAVQMSAYVNPADQPSTHGATIRSRVYDRIRRIASRHSDTAAEISKRFGLDIVTTRIVLPESIGFGVTDGPAACRKFARTLDAAASDVGASSIHGLVVSVEGSPSTTGYSSLQSIPHLLASYPRVNVTINCDRTPANIRAETIVQLALAIKQLLAQSVPGNSDELTRIRVTVGGPAAPHQMPPSATRPDAQICFRAAAGRGVLNVIETAPADTDAATLSERMANAIHNLVRRVDGATEMYADLLSRRSGFLIDALPCESLLASSVYGGVTANELQEALAKRHPQAVLAKDTLYFLARAVHDGQSRARSGLSDTVLHSLATVPRESNADKRVYLNRNASVESIADTLFAELGIARNNNYGFSFSVMA